MKALISLSLLLMVTACGASTDHSSTPSDTQATPQSSEPSSPQVELLAIMKRMTNEVCECADKKCIDAAVAAAEPELGRYVAAVDAIVYGNDQDQKDALKRDEKALEGEFNRLEKKGKACEAAASSHAEAR